LAEQIIDIEKIRGVLYRDNFLRGADVVIDEVRENYALLSMKLSEKHLNEMKNPQGGAIFTLADSACAVVCNIEAIMQKGDTDTVNRSSSITYLKPAKGKVLYAEGTMYQKGRKTGLCIVEIYDDLGTKVAYFTSDTYTL
jgi:acyl-CoA thioesterase